MFRNIFYLLTFLLITVLYTPIPAYAQGVGCGGGFGPIADFFCKITVDPKNPDAAKKETGERLNKVVSSIIGFLTICAALWFLFKILLAGYAWISAGGDTEKTTEAWHTITNGIIGLIIVVAAWVIVGLIGSLIGLDILNPGKIIGNLTL